MEYWCTGSDLVYCDGDADISTPNHECVVVRHYFEEILARMSTSEYGGHRELFSMLRQFEDGEDIIDVVAFRCAIHDALGSLERQGLITPEEAQDPYRVLLAEKLGMAYDAVLLGIGQYDGDPILYAQKNLHWSRIVDKSIDTFQITRRKLQGLGFALSDDFEDDALFTIEDRSTGRVYDVTVGAMKTKLDLGMGKRLYSPAHDVHL